MASSFEMQIIEEGPRNAIVKITGYTDNGNVSFTPAISLSDFNNNDKNLTLTGFRVDVLEWSISKDMEFLLAWDSSNPQQIYNIAGRGSLKFVTYSGGLVPDKTRPNYSGNINLTSSNANVGDTNNFTITLVLVKLYS